VAAHSLCCGCDGTGWIPYRSETVDGELEEAYRLCPGCYAPRRCMGFKIGGYPCPRPGTVRYGLGYCCKEHLEVIHVVGNVHHTQEAIYYLRRWLRIARDKANGFLEVQLSEALGKAETRLRYAQRGLDQDCEDTKGS